MRKLGQRVSSRRGNHWSRHLLCSATVRPDQAPQSSWWRIVPDVHILAAHASSLRPLSKVRLDITRIPIRSIAQHTLANMYRFYLVEGSFCAGTRAGMAHAHLLLTWFNANSNAANAPSEPRPSKRSLVQTAILALKKKLRDSKTKSLFLF